MKRTVKIISVGKKPRAVHDSKGRVIGHSLYKMVAITEGEGKNRRSWTRHVPINTKFEEGN